MEQLLEFTNNHLLLTGGLVASGFLLLFSEYKLQAGSGSNLSVAEAIKMINEDAQVLDIRSAEAFAKGHITGAKNLPADQVDGDSPKLSGLEGKRIIVTCDTGTQCSRAVATLRAKGYENVFSLKGGLAAWTEDKLPLVSARKKNKKGKK